MPLRVLIADDHAPARDDVQRALEDDERFSICGIAADAAEAVQAAIRKRPDVCILDIQMPGNGLAAAWEIASRLPHAKIVMLTVSENETDLFAALQAGASGYLPKTMDLGRLPDAVHDVCSGQAAIPRALVAHMAKQFRGREPRWRRPVPHSSAPRRLTSREWEVLDLLAQDRSTAKIAEKLVLSQSAVRAHITSIVRKLQVEDRAAAASLFRRQATAGLP